MSELQIGGDLVDGDLVNSNPTKGDFGDSDLKKGKLANGDLVDSDPTNGDRVESNPTEDKLANGDLVDSDLVDFEHSRRSNVPFECFVAALAEWTLHPENTARRVLYCELANEDVARPQLEALADSFKLRGREWSVEDNFTVTRKLVSRHEEKDAPLMEDVEFDFPNRSVTLRPHVASSEDVRNLPVFYPQVKEFKVTYTDFEISQLDHDAKAPEEHTAVRDKKEPTKRRKNVRKGEEEAKSVNLPPNECVLHIHALMHVAKEEVQMMKYCKRYLNTLHKWSTSRMAPGGYEKRSFHDQQIPYIEYWREYKRMKAKYKYWVDQWTEKTDARKFVYEELALATYLICLWRKEAKEEDATAFLTAEAAVGGSTCSSSNSSNSPSASAKGSFSITDNPSRRCTSQSSASIGSDCKTCDEPHASSPISADVATNTSQAEHKPSISSTSPSRTSEISKHEPENISSEKGNSDVKSNVTKNSRPQSKSPYFVDLGCGNGFLTYLLTSEGFRGCGIDLQKREIWDKYDVEVDLRHSAVDPSSLRFPEADWILANHADELSIWVPVIAFRSSRKTKFWNLPCCFYGFSGAKFRRINGRLSQYEGFLEYLRHLTSLCGFDFEKDMMRIPSTKNVAHLGRTRRYTNLSEEMQEAEENAIEAAIEAELSLRSFEGFTARENPSKLV